MELYTLLTFFLIVSVMVMSPGPNGALLLKNVPTFGKQHGYANVLGIVVAFYLHGTLSVLGLSAIIVSSANLFLLVKILGALYLAYLGVKAIVSAFAKKTTSSIEQKSHNACKYRNELQIVKNNSRNVSRGHKVVMNLAIVQCFKI